MSPYADHDPESLGARFAVMLLGHRLAAGLTQEDLAGRSGVGVRTLRELERGRVARPQRNTVSLLADALSLTGVDRAEFLAVATGRPPAAVSPPGFGPGSPAPDRRRHETAQCSAARLRLRPGR